MNSHFILFYILKTILVSGIFYVNYRWVLRDKKFHNYNRFYLLSVLTLSLLIPLIKINLFTLKDPVVFGSVRVSSLINNTFKTDNNIHVDWMDFTLIIGFIIMMALFTIMLFNIFRIYRIKRNSEITNMKDFDFISTDAENAPFSFLNNLFWKKSISLNDKGGQQIFKHEVTHIQQKHTWDRLYCQIVSVVFWMNPFNWLIQKELQTIHEFIADEGAVENADAETFAGMLLQTHYGNHFLNPIHPFFYSSIKRRLIMLNTSTKTRFSYLRRLLVLPLFLVSLCIFSIKLNATQKNNDITFLSDKPTVDTLPPTAPVDLIANGKKPLYIVDGKEISPEEAGNIDPKDIYAINVLKEKNATLAYGEKGKNGVVKITMKKNPQADVKKALLVIDGKIVKDKTVNDINPDEIASINVLKGDNATNLYGEEGKNGAIVIITKKK